MKLASFTDNSQSFVKYGDTDTFLHIQISDDGTFADLTQVTSIKVPVANDDGLLFTKTIDPKTLANAGSGIVDINFTADDQNNMPPDDYYLEIWVVNPDSTIGIYPADENQLSFTITDNLTLVTGDVVPAVAFDDFQNMFNTLQKQVQDSIANGLKGDKGDPGEGLDIKGQVTSVSALPTTASEGDGYLVNEELYVWTNSAWKDCGPIQGPQGIQGIQGKTGTGISSTTIKYQISSSATTAPTGTWSNNIVATTTTNSYLWTKVTLNYTDGTTKDFYLVSQKGDKGDKGDTGTVDNAGLTAAPAFVGLQTQVDNSAVGTNLLTGTNNTLTTINNATDWGITSPYTTSEKLEANQTYTVSCYLEPAEHDAAVVTKTESHGTTFGTPVTAGSKGISTLTITLTQEDVAKGYFCWLTFTNGQTDKSAVSFKGFKLEKGSVATDWCPNPSEILTQGDKPDLSNYTTVTDLNNGLSTKVTDNKNGTIEVNGNSITPADDSKVLHSTVTQLNSTDMNTVKTTGFYQLNSGTNGMPNTDNETIYQVIPISGWNGVQLAYETNSTILGMRSWYGGNIFTSWVRFADDSKVLHLSTGNTASRPTGISAGYQYFDTSLNKPIWYTSKNWVDATGTTV